MFDGAKEQVQQAKDYVMSVNDKADKAVDDRIDQLQAAINNLQARLDRAKELRFTWLIAAGIAAALLSLGALIVF
jgi:hypothetical protein